MYDDNGGLEVRDDTKTDLSDDNMLMNDENAHGGLDPFKAGGNNNNNNNNDDEDDDNDNDDQKDENPFSVGSSDEGGLDETKPGSSDNLLNSKEKSASLKGINNNNDDDASRSLLFSKSKRPTSAGEPSPNVPTRCDISVLCEIRYIFGITIILLFLITLFDSIYIEKNFQSLLHWINDRSPTLGKIALGLAIFDVPLLNIAGGADVILMSGSGYIWGFEFGSIIYTICSLIGCLICFIIGKTLYRDKFFQFMSLGINPKYENYRLLDRSIQDYGFWLTISLRLCPFIPFGFTSYLLSFTGLTWQWFALGHFFGSFTSIVMFTYSGDIENNINNINVEIYKNNDASYAVIVLVSVLFVITLFAVSFLIYKRFDRLVTGDNKSNMELDESETEDSDSEDASLNNKGKEIGGSSDDANSDSENIIDDDLDGIVTETGNSNIPQGMGDIEMAQYDNSVNNNNNINNNNNKSNKKKKKKKRKNPLNKIGNKRNNRKESFFSSGWDNEQAGLAMESPFGEGTDVYDEKPSRDLDVAAMDPGTPRR